jgi:hypothetical protein
MRPNVKIALLLFFTSTVLGAAVFFFWYSSPDEAPAVPDSASGATGQVLSGSETGRNPAIRTLSGYDTLQDEIDKQARTDALSTVSDENLATQVETDAAGNKRLASRRLLLNNLKLRNVRDSSELLAALEEVRTAVVKQRIQFTEVDAMLLLAGLRIEMPANNICAGMDELSDTEKRSSFLPYLVRTCGDQK